MLPSSETDLMDVSHSNLDDGDTDNLRNAESDSVLTWMIERENLFIILLSSC